MGQGTVVTHWVYEDGTHGGPDAPAVAVTQQQVDEAQLQVQQQVHHLLDRLLTPAGSRCLASIAGPDVASLSSSGAGRCGCTEPVAPTCCKSSDHAPGPAALEIPASLVFPTSEQKRGQHNVSMTVLGMMSGLAAMQCSAPLPCSCGTGTSRAGRSSSSSSFCLLAHKGFCSTYLQYQPKAAVIMSWLLALAASSMAVTLLAVDEAQPRRLWANQARPFQGCSQVPAWVQADAVRSLKDGGKGNSDPEVQAAVEELLKRKSAVEQMQVPGCKWRVWEAVQHLVDLPQPCQPCP